MLRLAYLLNILILAPVCASLWSDPPGHPPRAMEGKFPDSPGLRYLVFSLWGSILILSLAGLAWPQELCGLLVFQVLYKSIYLLGFLLPRGVRQGRGSLPWGITLSFLLIVLLYPWILWSSSSGT